MAKPTDDIEFATSGLTLEPATLKKQEGFLSGKKLPARWLNWFMRAYWRWIDWFDDVLGSDDHKTINIVGDSSSTRAAIAGLGGNNNVGVYGEGAGSQAGVVGVGGATNGNGVYGEAKGSGYGVYGVGATGGNGTGVRAVGSGGGRGLYAEGGPSGATAIYGEGTGSNTIGVDGIGGPGGNGIGVRGSGTLGGNTVGVFGTNSNSDGFGVLAQNTAGVALRIIGDTTSPAKAAIRVVPQNAEPTGPNEVGDMYVTSAGVLKICTVAGSPGTWMSVGAQT